MTLIRSQSESLPTTENDTVKTQKSGLTYRKSQPNRRIFVTDSRTARTMDIPYQCRLWLGFRTIFPLSRHLLWMCIVLVLAASLPYCRCQTDYDECVSDPCQNNGTCWDQVDGYLCNCTANYTGDNCQIKVCTGWVNTADPAADVRTNPADLPENSFCSAATPIKVYSMDNRH